MAVKSARKLILVIDREPTNRDWLKQVLTSAGYDVLTARGGPQALAQADKNRIDLVITSLATPEPALRTLQIGRPQLKIVATTGTLDSATLRAADLRGAQAVLTRPLGSKVLLQRVAVLLKSRPVAYAASEEPPAFPANRRVPR